MMNILMLDVGGTSVKMMVSGDRRSRKFSSGRRLTGAQMVERVKAHGQGWEFDAVSGGFPGIVRDGRIANDPLNLGGGWTDFDFEGAFGRPVRVINDAAMQALAHYEEGRVLFLGLGTSVGCTLVADDTVIPMEAGAQRLSSRHTFADRLSRVALETYGRKRWEKHVWEAVALLRDMFFPDRVMLGGGNAKRLEEMPPGCRLRDNKHALRGALRLWPGQDHLHAEPHGTTWRIERTAEKPTQG